MLITIEQVQEYLVLTFIGKLAVGLAGSAWHRLETERQAIIRRHVYDKHRAKLKYCPHPDCQQL